MSKTFEWLEKEKALQDMMARTRNNVGKYTPQSKELDREKAKELAKEFSYLKNPKKLFDKLTANPIIIGIVLVTGYFAYKKFKK